MTQDERDGPERRKDLTTREVINAAVDRETKKSMRDWVARLDTWIKRGLIAYAIIGILVAVSLSGFGYVLVLRANDLKDVQSQRALTTIRNCVGQTARNVKAKIRVLDNKQLNAGGRQFSLDLIDAVAPVEDCDAKAEQATTNGG